MALKFKPKPIATVTVEHVANKVVTSKDTTNEAVDIPGELCVGAPACEVGLSAAYTHGLPNFSSVRMGVSLKIGCAHGEIDGVYEYVETWIDKRMGALKDALTGE
jgi:hypothetical protein